MKTTYVILLAVFSLFQEMYAQSVSGIYRKDLPDIFISEGVSLHFISPEPITYVDISTSGIAGDLPVKNILRLKIKTDSLTIDADYMGVVTIIGESFIAQYNLRYPGVLHPVISSQVQILPEQMRPLDVPGIGLTGQEMKSYALAILKDHSRSGRKASAYGLKARLNHVYTIGDDIFLDLTYKNETNLAYDMDELRFKIEDKKINKATNVQSIEIEPVWQLYPLSSFKKTFRNIYVLKKVTFPENKVLNIELTEKQISGRTLTLQIKYRDILKADTF
ncbi:Bacteroides conjugative transposon TraN protein [Daejeonella rubra]|uniref:Bacteroides conjugative transposon TraN protein n=1 Tax=Daejeonella rubra TaxID=990371 RepID=A0A1G9NK18_9SPHI|nr:conjugative transposon protein TraN [Daejeonella rubra]SDL86367.1 Bacteroides conjugative transposon TraN protein [Daejeonella rubra]